MATTLSPALADAQDEAVQSAAVDWLVGRYQADAVTTPGSLSDLIFALAGADAAPATVAAARAELESAAADYVSSGGDLDEGPLAKAVLGVSAGGGDPTNAAGSDLEAELRSLMIVEGPDAGRFNDAGPFTQALAIMALQTTAAGAPVQSARWLASRRCPDGGFEFGVDESMGMSLPCMASGTEDIDTTALAIQALLDVEETQADQDGAVTWLRDQQAADGGFAANANSTGLAGQALRAVGQVQQADSAADFVGTLQVPAGSADAGAIRFTAQDDGSLLLATTQGILTLGAPAFQLIHAGTQTQGPAGACTTSDGVTVVVDLTFFDGGNVLQGCAPGDPVTGLDALRSAGFDVVTQTSEFGEFVCSIQGLPQLGCDQPFEGQFWAYSQGQPDGSWTPYEVGADASDPTPGVPEGWRYGEGEGPSVPAPTGVGSDLVTRLSAADRVATAVVISGDGFTDGGAGGVVLTRADDYADALAGTPLAVSLHAPLLITPHDALPKSVATEIQRVLPAGGTVHILGGPAAIDGLVDQQVRDLGYEVQRVAGEDRIATALRVAEALGEPGQLLITTGYDYPDALAAGTAAAAVGDAAVLLTGAGTPHPAVDAYLADHPAATVFAIGGPAATAYPEATAVVGDTREGTAVAVALRFFPAPSIVGIARRDDFADSLAGGAHIAAAGGPLLITQTDTLSAEVTQYLCETGSVDSAVVYGGPAAVSQDVVNALAGALQGSVCG
ncbi:MAG: cell wall-binding repeat-containing protein [Euzebya sp.]